MSIEILDRPHTWRRHFLITTAIASVLVAADTFVASEWSPAVAQSALPQVTVEAPRAARRASVRRRVETRATRSTAQRPARPQQQVVGPTLPPATNPALGPVNGYVAGSSTTGTKTATPALENPQSVSVVGRQEIEQQGSQTVAESLRYTAGVLAGSRPGNRFDDIFIRGFGGFGFTAGYVQFLDGLKMQRGVSYGIPSVDPWGLERVEVIKGPASVLYGQSTPGGLVNMVSKRPTDRSFGIAEMQVGNYGRLQGAIDIGGPIDADGRWLYRLTALGLDSNTSVNYTEQQRIFVAPAITWRPTADTTITWLTHYQNDPKSYQPNYLPAQGLLPGIKGVPANPYGKLPTDFYVGDPGHDSFKRQWFATGYEFEHRFNEIWTFRQNLRYQHLESEFYAIPANPGYVNPANPNSIQRAKTSVEEVFDGVVVDNQAEAKFRTGFIDHKVLVGVDYQYSDANRLLGQARGVPNLSTINPQYYQNIPRAAFQTDQTQQSSFGGIYVQDQMKIDRLILSLAGRYDISDIRFDTLTFANNSRSVVDQNDRKGTYRAGAMYLLDGGLAPYINASTSFEPAPYLAVGNTPLQPMTGQQWEVGIKYQPPGWDMLLTVSYFDIRQQNVVNSDPLNIGFYVQTGEVSSRGIEIEAKANLTKNFSAIGSFTYVDAEVTRDRLPINVGKRPFSVPETMGSLWGDYRLTSGALAGFGIGAGVRYIGETAGDPANTFFVPSVVLADAAIHYDFGYLHPDWKGWSARVNANNLFDKEYVAACYTLSNGCFWGARRTVVASLRRAW